MAIIENSHGDYAQIRIHATKDVWTRTYWAKVDAADWRQVSQHTWHLSFDGRMVYPQTQIRVAGKRKGTISLGRMVMGEGELGNLGRVDHINGNGMDCRRQNLRILTQSQLLAKRQPMGGASQYKGVSWDQEQEKWLAAFRGKKVGRFTNERDAARAFDDAALAYWGPDSGVYLNFAERPRGVAMTGAKARLLVFAVEACLNTENMQADPAAGAALRAARDAVERWTYEPVGWVQPVLDHA